MAAHSSYTIRDCDVSFPFVPYPSQLVFMDKVIETLQRPQRNALLESPTGTGKTLCLLCASLAWRQAQAAFLQAGRLLPTQGAEELRASVAKAAFGSAQPPSNNGDSTSFAQTPGRIIYLSRTHGQLTQVVRELRNTSYKPKTTVLGSRQQFCVHPDVSKLRGSAQNNACQKLVGARTCMYHNNVLDHKIEHREVLEGLMDIEDLCKHGEKHRVCPYYLSRDTAGDAEVIFMPYNYLTDPGSRRAMGHLWKDSIVIFDEAHNMEQICSEAASFDFTSKDIAMCINEVERCIALLNSGVQLTLADPASPEELMILKALFLEFEKVIDGITLRGDPPSCTRPGDFIFELFEASGIKHNNAPDLIAMLERGVNMLSEAQGASLNLNPTLKQFADGVQTVFKATNLQDVTKLYKVHIHEKEAKKNQARSNDITSFTSAPAGKKNRALGYWCFSAGVTMRDILGLGVRNILLASGTLSPMSSWSSEMDMDFEVTLENTHVIAEHQLMASVVRRGPMNVNLNSSFRCRDNDDYKNEIGYTIVNASRVVPDGLLVFFPSYAALSACEQAWKFNGIWERINRHKQIFLEPRDSSAFKATVTAYTEEVDRQGPGAVLMAVCRGKMSEGIDFADRHGRAVIITGIPYPAAFEPRVVLKQSFLDELAAKAKKEGKPATLSGQRWYLMQAARAVNQAIGRVIRHKDDFGAILLCDERFAGWKNQALLSKWVQPQLEIADQFGTVAQRISTFFQQHKDTVVASRERASRAAESQSGSGGGHITPRYESGDVGRRIVGKGMADVDKALEFEAALLSAGPDKTGHSLASTKTGSLLVDLEDEFQPSGSTQNSCLSVADTGKSLSDQLLASHQLQASRPPLRTPKGSENIKHNRESAVGKAGAQVGQKSASPGSTQNCTPSTVKKQQNTQGQVEFLTQAKSTLGKEDYVRFRELIKALQKADDAGRAKVLEDLHSLLGKRERADILNSLLRYLSRKLQEQMRGYIARHHPTSLALLS